MEPKTSIAIERIQNDNVKEAVFAALNAIHTEKLFIKQEMNILLKPNVLMGNPQNGRLLPIPRVTSVIQWVKQFDPAKIFVADSSGGLALGASEKNLKICSVAVCEEEGDLALHLRNLNPFVYPVINPLIIKEFSGSVLLRDADIIINLPKIKTHEQFFLTCCVKNMFGTIMLDEKA